MSVEFPEVDLVVAGLRSGDFSVSGHALERMEERFISRADIQSAAFHHDDAWLDREGKVHVIGPDQGGSSIEIVAVFDGGTLVVTVFGD